MSFGDRLLNECAGATTSCGSCESSAYVAGFSTIGGIDWTRPTLRPLRTQGWIVNHKRIARIMREDNLLTVQRDWFRPADHSLRAARIYLNLANRMSVLGPN